VFRGDRSPLHTRREQKVSRPQYREDPHLKPMNQSAKDAAHVPGLHGFSIFKMALILNFASTNGGDNRFVLPERRELILL